VTVRDDDGGIGTASFTVTVNNALPTVLTATDLSGMEGANLDFVATFSVHPAEACASLPVRRKIYVRQELRRQGAVGRKGATWKEGMVGGTAGFFFSE